MCLMNARLDRVWNRKNRRSPGERDKRNFDTYAYVSHADDDDDEDDRSD